MNYKGAENLAHNFEPEPTAEKFLSLAPNEISRLLEKTAGYFDFLKEETSAQTIRKLTELIKLFKEAGKTELAEKLKTIKKEIYERLEINHVPECLENFSEEEKTAVMADLGSIELTEGCSVACNFCGLEAKPGVRGHTPFGDLVYLANRYSSILPRKLGEFYLYWASEPLDYEDGDKNYLDVVELFKFYGLEPYTSTAYPNGKKELLAEMIEKGYINRVSVSKQNLKRLKEEGWITEDEKGNFSTTTAAIQAGLDKDWISEGNEPLYKLGKKDVVAGRAFEENKEVTVGGIECKIGVILKRDGFYNNLICNPSKKHRIGVVAQKIEHKNISQQLEKNNLPQNAEELIKYGIVENRQTHPFSNYQYFTMINFHNGERRRYYVEYEPNELEIKDFEEIKPEEKQEFKAFIATKIAIGEFSGNEPLYKIEDILTVVFRIMPIKLDVKKMNKESVFYKKLVEVTKKYLEDFITSPLLILEEKYGFYAKHNLSEIDEDTKFERDELNELVTAFKNAFALAREALDGITPEKIDEAEQKFMDRLYDSLLKANLGANLKPNEHKESKKFLNKLFAK